ncbi:hypothetical protein, partial [Vibrio owensii]|uniref:hypothetical protein n=1 Tax=Vibrio owensii TaxID=696485 RepID=UPI001A8E0F82
INHIQTHEKYSFLSFRDTSLNCPSKAGHSINNEYETALNISRYNAHQGCRRKVVMSLFTKVKMSL